MKTNSPNSWNTVLAARKLFLIFTIFHIILMHIAYFILAETFQFPEILRKPAEIMLSAFMAKGSINLFSYYLFTLSGFTFIILHLFLYSSLENKSSLIEVGRTFAIIAGLLQALGFGRWVFLVPWIAETISNGSINNETSLLILEAFHRYVGLLVGENLAFLAHGISGIFFSIHLLREPSAPKFFGIIGIPIHFLIGMYSLEQFGGVFSGLGTWNVVFQVLWLEWLFFTALYLLLSKENQPKIIKTRDFIVMIFVLTTMLLSTLL